MTLLFSYGLLLLIAFILQRKLMYYPEQHTALQQKQIIAHLNLTLWPDKQDYRGLIRENSKTFSRGTVLVLHGNAGSAAGRIYYIDALEKQGFRVILAEYPGFGTRPGKPSEKALVQDAIETAKLAVERYGEPLYLWGESLGGGVVSGVVKSQQVPVAGIILLMPFDSMSRIAQRHYWYLLGGLLTLDRYNNSDNLKDFKGPTAVILAENDQVIPNAHTLRLYESLPEPKKSWTFENAGHNTWPADPNLPWWGEVMDFVSQEKAK